MYVQFCEQLLTYARIVYINFENNSAHIGFNLTTVVGSKHATSQSSVSSPAVCAHLVEIIRNTAGRFTVKTTREM